MHDETFEHAAKEWKDGFAKWEGGERPEYCDPDDAKLEFWEWEGGPPDREYYRPWKDEEATWFQVWETVSEGTPVTPPFATREELAAHLAEYGDDWDRRVEWLGAVDDDGTGCATGEQGYRAVLSGASEA